MNWLDFLIGFSLGGAICFVLGGATAMAIIKQEWAEYRKPPYG